MIAAKQVAVIVTTTKRKEGEKENLDQKDFKSRILLEAIEEQ